MDGAQGAYCQQVGAREDGRGVERYVLDDGWFGSRRDDTSGLGDWVVSPDVWPLGLHPLVDRVHGLGMQFGRWLEPEMVNPDSDVARAHPEWIMAARTEWPVESRHQQVLNLGIPEAYEHVKKQILAILIDYIKWDHNRDLIEAGNQLEGGRPGVHAQTLAFYALLREIRSLHTGLEIESCSSGGARVDLGVLEHTDRVWVSDNIDPHDRQTMQRWTTQLLPPEYMGSHIASGRSHTTGRQHDLAFRAGTRSSDTSASSGTLPKPPPRRYRPSAGGSPSTRRNAHSCSPGDVVRMDGPDSSVMVHGIVSRDRSRAIFAAAALESLYPDATCRVEPVFPGATPSGLRPPVWWGRPTAAGQAVEPTSLRGAIQDDVIFPGGTFPGTVLAKVGVASPRIHPDQVVLYSITSSAELGGAVLGQGGSDLFTDVGEDGLIAAAQVDRRGGADVDDRGDHAGQRRRILGADPFVAGEKGRDAVLQASRNREAFAPMVFGGVSEDEFVQVRAAVFDVLPHAGHHGAYQRQHLLQRAVDGVRRGKAVVDGGCELLVLHHDQQLRFRRRVQVQGPDRDIGTVGNLLGCHPAHAAQCEEFPGGDPDSFPFVLLRPLPAPYRCLSSSHGDLP